MKYLSTNDYKRTSSRTKIYTWVEAERDTVLGEIEHDYYNDLRPHDFDYCGEEVVFYYFENGEAYKLSHEWWRDDYYDGDDDDHCCLKWGHEVTKITLEELPEDLRKCITIRDWLVV